MANVNCTCRHSLSEEQAAASREGRVRAFPCGRCAVAAGPSSRERPALDCGPRGPGTRRRRGRSSRAGCGPAPLRAARSRPGRCSRSEARRPAPAGTRPETDSRAGGAGWRGCHRPWRPHSPELTRCRPARPRPVPADCVLCPGLSFSSQDGTVRVSVHTVIAGTAAGMQNGRGGCGEGGLRFNASSARWLPVLPALPAQLPAPAGPCPPGALSPSRPFLLSSPPGAGPVEGGDRSSQGRPEQIPRKK